MANVVYLSATTCRLIFRARLHAVIGFALAMVVAWCVERVRVAGAPGPGYSSGRVCVRRS